MRATKLLREVGGRLAVTRDADMVARQGGDEFLVLLADVELDAGEPIVPRALEVVSAIENKVRSVLETPFLVADTDVHVGQHRCQHLPDRCHRP